MLDTAPKNIGHASKKCRTRVFFFLFNFRTRNPSVRYVSEECRVRHDTDTSNFSKCPCIIGFQKGLQDVKYQVAPSEEQAGIPYTEGVMADELHVNCQTPAIIEYDGTTDLQEHLSRFENMTLLHRYTDSIKCRVFVTTFARAAQQWFNQLPSVVIGSFQEFRSLFMHQFASSRKHRKTEMSLFSIR
ncbi:UNVERIFIED_CONTAM: hypothetical protein Slati_3802300 [Sesamum latifolium]|uniref:Retrotransposon gag domain-containing protein n=1 Tax=Sesamum latifolium TaxID=2727402 RepID=A0AAW2U8Q6_9LAMI